MNESMVSNFYQRNNLYQWSLPISNSNKSDISFAKPDYDLINQNKMNNINQADRVTMKIDVSYTDHSHVIGKGGQSIKSIMTETQCHIHFPDSNRTNTIEKSNQVSISGLSSGVELARQKIRCILPLIYSFDIPYAPYNILEQKDRTLIAQLQKLLEVSVSYRPMAKSVNGTTVYVKGIILRSKPTIKAVNIILGHHFGQNIEQVPVTMTIEVDPKHHSFLLNQGGQNSLGNEIFLRTGATVHFPDNTFTPAHAVLAASNPMGISGLFKKSTVTIWGTAESTFEARQLLIGRLPVILMYDITIEEGVNLEMFNLNSINEKFDVSISIKLKLKQSTKSVIIRTTEQNVSALFEVKKILNCLRTQYKPIIQTGLKSLPTQLSLSRMNNMIDFKPDTTNHLINGNGEKPDKNPITSTIYPQQAGTKNDNQINLMDQRSSILNKINFSNESFNTPPTNPILSCHGYNGNINCNDSISMSQNIIIENNEIIKHRSHINENISFNKTMTNDSNSSTSQDSYTSDNVVDWRAPGAEYSAKQRELKRSMDGSPIDNFMDDLSKKCSNIHIMQSNENSENEYSNLSNFIKSNESFRINDADLKMYQIDENINHAHIKIDFPKTCLPLNEVNGATQNVAKILESLELGRYIETFVNNEVDYGTFCSLTENDLKELGVHTLGARRKLMIAISDLSSASK